MIKSFTLLLLLGITSSLSTFKLIKMLRKEWLGNLLQKDNFIHQKILHLMTDIINRAFNHTVIITRISIRFNYDYFLQFNDKMLRKKK